MRALATEIVISHAVILPEKVGFVSLHKPCSVYVDPYISYTVDKLHLQDVCLRKKYIYIQ